MFSEYTIEDFKLFSEAIFYWVVAVSVVFTMFKSSRINRKLKRDLKKIHKVLKEHNLL